ncbi:capsule assembly Wzi family protein [Mucilaginibacter sp.]|uniref:capsule assembly Wzi family protein n=1 Tax=Mucilaginibacter sp. TaxID=1882438 RepID=UPI0025E9011D|nr:capsule assembly Wzi family protein [Mucilaginibacter sp.]
MKKTLILTTILLVHLVVNAQVKDVHASLELQGVETTNDVVPFWLRSNQFGSIPLSGTSGSLIGKIRKDYDTTKTFGWGASFEGRGNIGQGSQFILVEGLVKAHAGIFELKAGRSKDVVGLVDSLSSGSFPVSGNALGIPQISLSIPNYYSIPILGKLFAVKGAFANGYVGDVHVNSGRRSGKNRNYFLSNSVYVRVGQPSWRFKFLAGYNHEALWGDEKHVFPRFDLSGWETYKYVVTGKVYQGSKVGNHLGSLDLGAEYKFDALTLLIYKQSFFDKGGLGSLANIQDGLNGISLINNEKNNTGNFYWKKAVFELFYSVNQAGALDAKSTKSGAEDYYNNYEYLQGWSYKNLALGNPFITTTLDARSNLVRSDNQFFVNNRVKAFYGAAQFYAFKWFYTGKLSYSVNYGTYATGSEPYRGVGGIKQPSPIAFGKINQVSAYLEGLRPLKNGYNIGYDIGYDKGGLLYNSFGVILKASKTFL